MKVTFLGTGTSQGVPVIGSDHPVCLSDNPKDKRLRSSILVEWDGLNFVVDSGPDFRYQMLRAGVKKLDALLFTHEHKDHIAGFDDIRPFYFNQGAIQVYCSRRVKESLQKSFDYIFHDFKYPGVPEVDIHLIDKEPFDASGKELVPLEVLHYKLPVHAFRFGDFTYVTDANHIDESERKKIRGSKVVVLNALRQTTHISHFSLEEAVEMAQDLGAEKTYFTHISHLLGFHDEVEESLPDGIHLAYDMLEVEL